MNPRFTRRQWATALAAALPVGAQTPATAAAAELEKALEQIRSNSKALSAQLVPMATEPAFVFKP